MAGEEDVELRDLVAHTLETKGVLGKIRAQLRASVFLALEEQESQQKPHPLVSSNIQQYLKTKNGQLVTALVREFLNFFDLDYTCSVFDPETNVLETYPGRQKLATDLGLDSSSTDGPLLDCILQRANSSAQPPPPLSTASTTSKTKQEDHLTNNFQAAHITTSSSVRSDEGSLKVSVAFSSPSTVTLPRDAQSLFGTSTTTTRTTAAATTTMTTTTTTRTKTTDDSNFLSDLPSLDSRRLPHSENDALFGSDAFGLDLDFHDSKTEVHRNESLKANDRVSNGGTKDDLDIFNSGNDEEKKSDRVSYEDDFSDGSISEHLSEKLSSSNPAEETEDVTISESNLLAANFDYTEQPKT